MEFYYRWQDAVRALAEKIRENRPLPGRNMILENSGDGVILHAGESNFGEEGNGYRGSFALKLMSELVPGSGANTVQVIGSGVSEQLPAGYVFWGGKQQAIPVSAPILLPEEGEIFAVCLEIEFSEPSGNVLTNITCHRVLPEAMEEFFQQLIPRAWQEKRLLGWVIRRENTMECIQHQYGDIILNRWG